ncbi:hypothetical protein C8T65DRAFT_63565 [Cerioporus squamosus]|nr:hypothetical protein C8T65DRAFT_63565 [Cerioporus squamosus]
MYLQRLSRQLRSHDCLVMLQATPPSSSLSSLQTSDRAGVRGECFPPALHLRLLFPARSIFSSNRPFVNHLGSLSPIWHPLIDASPHCRLPTSSPDRTRSSEYLSQVLAARTRKYLLLPISSLKTAMPINARSTHPQVSDATPGSHAPDIAFYDRGRPRLTVQSCALNSSPGPPYPPTLSWKTHPGRSSADSNHPTIAATTRPGS